MTQDDDSPLKHSPDIAPMSTLLAYSDCEKENLPIEIGENSSDISISPVELEYPAMEIVPGTIADDESMPMLTDHLLGEQEEQLTQEDAARVVPMLTDGVVMGDSEPSAPDLKRKRGRPARAKIDQKSAISNATEPIKAVSAKAGGKKISKAAPAPAGEGDEQGKTASKKPRSNSSDVSAPTISPEVQTQIEIKSTMIAGWVSDLR